MVSVWGHGSVELKKVGWYIHSNHWQEKEVEFGRGQPVQYSAFDQKLFIFPEWRHTFEKHSHANL